MGLLDFKVDVVLARLEADFSDQPPSIPAVPNHQVSLQGRTAEYPCCAQPQSIPAGPNRRVSLLCPTAKYPCSAQPLSILAVPNRKVFLQCPTAKYPCSAQLRSIPAVSNHQISLQGPTEKYPCSAQPESIPWSAQQQSINILAAHLQCCKEDAARKTVDRGQGTLHFLCNNGFRVGMLEVNNFCSKGLCSDPSPGVSGRGPEAGKRQKDRADALADIVLKENFFVRWL